LTIRARSRRELQDRLLRAGFDAAEVDDVLDGLESAGLVDDQRLAQALVEHAVSVRLAGHRAVLGALWSRRVDPKLAGPALTDADEDESRRAHELAVLRARQLHGLKPEVAMRRLTAFLGRRGYGLGLAREAAARALAVDPSGED
jgi:regulatory protein